MKHSDCSIWTGGSKESWFNYDRMTKYRKLINPENHAKIEGLGDFFYLLSVDVGRISCQTVCSVFKVYKMSSGFRTALVNLFVLGKTDRDKHFEFQARDLKKIIRDFQPKEVVIDGNGLGRLYAPIYREIYQQSLLIAGNSFYKDNQQRSIK